MDAIMEKAPAAQLELNGKTYTINHMGTATYLRYKQACEAVSLEEDAIDAPTYTAIINALSIAFGEQFTPEELAESDTDVADVIVAYMAVDLNMAQRIEQKIDAMTANFKTGS